MYPIQIEYCLKLHIRERINQHLYQRFETGGAQWVVHIKCNPQIEWDFWGFLVCVCVLGFVLVCFLGGHFFGLFVFVLFYFSRETFKVFNASRKKE